MEVSRRISAPPERIWQILTDTALWPIWGPSLREVSCAERHITQGSTGSVKTLFGVWVPFEVTHLEQGRCWEWKVMGVPATWHRVEPVWDEDRLDVVGTTLTFGLPALALPYALVCRRALKKIDALVHQESHVLPGAPGSR